MLIEFDKAILINYLLYYQAEGIRLSKSRNEQGATKPLAWIKGPFLKKLLQFYYHRYYPVLDKTNSSLLRTLPLTSIVIH